MGDIQSVQSTGGGSWTQTPPSSGGEEAKPLPTEALPNPSSSGFVKKPTVVGTPMPTRQTRPTAVRLAEGLVRFSANNQQKIVVSPQMADKLDDILDSSDFPIAEALQSGATRAFKNDSSTPEFQAESSPDDRTITFTELQRAFVWVQRSKDWEPARQATEYVMQETQKQISGTVIDTEEKAKKFLNILASRESHLRAGGPVITDEIATARKVSIEMAAPNLTPKLLRERIIKHDAYKYLSDVEVSYSIPAGNNVYYLVTVVSVTKMRWPVVNKLVIKETPEGLSAEWTLVPAAEATPVLMANKARLKAVMENKKGGNVSDEDVGAYLKNKIIDELSTVKTSNGGHTLKNGVYTHWQQSETSLNPPSNKIVMEAVLMTALHMKGDPRGPKMAVIISKGGQDKRCQFDAIRCR